MISMVVGGTTDTSARFVVKVDTGPAAVRYDTDEGFGDPTTSSSETVDAQGVAKIEVTGLTAGTRYHWQTVDNGTPDTGATGQFLTHPVAAGQPASYIYGAAGCAGAGGVGTASGSPLASDRISNATIFDTIRQQGLAEDWLGFVHLGDLHYYDLSSGLHGIAGGASLANFRRAYDDIMAQTRQHQLFQELPWIYTYDDHDWLGNDSDGSDATGRANAIQVYGERVPHYDLDGGGTGAIYQSWQVGRVLHVLPDSRADSDNTPDSTILGATQLSWLDDLLTNSTAEALVMWMSRQWLDSGADTWGGYPTEQAQLVTLFGDTGFLDRLVMVHADRHALGLTGGATNDHGGFPVLQAASMDTSFPGTSTLPDQFDVVRDRPGREHYGTVRVDDNGAELLITLTAYRNGDAMGWTTLNTSGTSTLYRAGGPSHVLAL